MQKPENIDSYISSFPPSTQKLLEQMRRIIQENAPDAKEVISYGMPAFKGRRILVYFAGYAQHIGFYPGADGIAAFAHEFSRYKYAKGSVQFPVNQPLPEELIARMVQFKGEKDKISMDKKTG